MIYTSSSGALTCGPLPILVAGYSFEYLFLKGRQTDFAAISAPGGADLLYKIVKAGGNSPPTSEAIHYYCSATKQRLVLELAKCNVIQDSSKSKAETPEATGVRRILGWCQSQERTTVSWPKLSGQMLLLTCDKPRDCAKTSPPLRPAIIDRPEFSVFLSHDLGRRPDFVNVFWRGSEPGKSILVTTVQDWTSTATSHSVRDFSWEGAAEDLQNSIHSWLSSPGNHFREMVSHLVVGLGPDAAVYARWIGPKRRVELNLIYYPKLAYCSREKSPTSFFFCEMLAAGIAVTLAKNGRIEQAIKNGVRLSHHLCNAGITDKAGRTIDKENAHSWLNSFVLSSPIGLPSFSHVSVGRLNTRSPWSLLTDRWRSHGTERWAKRALALGAKIVRNGMAHTAARYNFLFARIGGWLGVDRQEIEGYQSIRRLMTEYLEDPSFAKPLCLATFGPPGSGKSRGIKELTKSLANAGLKIDEKPLEFNMAEYKDSSGLAIALHKVRDCALTGKVPVAMFDEFDSTLEGAELGWLKYFLAPMQDGKFREGDSVYHTGRAIFVFAGGTRRSFDEFAGQMRNAWFIGAKGPDFVSRLRGHVNVAGLGSVDDDDEQQNAMNIVRKAVFLRTFLQLRLGKKEDERIDVEPAVCRALLCKADYRHGVRSMEAIIGMCARIPHGQMLTRSMLPPRDQLDMHLDAANFLKAIEEPG